MNSAKDFESLNCLFTESKKKVDAANNFRQYLPSQINTKSIKKEARKANISDIWDEDDVEFLDEDPRLQPEYSINYLQRVSSEDMYLGMSARTPSFSHSDDLQIKVILPNTELKDINLNITKESLEVLCPS
jgi:hypothetical protein